MNNLTLKKGDITKCVKSLINLEQYSLREQDEFKILIQMIQERSKR